MTEDDMRDLAIAIVDKFVKMGLVPNCTDTNNETEFEFQDAIVETLKERQQ
tara:strand:+ start:95 stop:247 length:153 start_codon:yes stop_codon:yes gene_type:complete